MKFEKVTALGLLTLVLSVLGAMPSFAQDADFNVHIAKARNYPFCEIFLLSGQPPDLEAQVYNTTSVDNCPPNKLDRLNVQTLAEQLKVDRVWLNPRRHWMMDQLWVNKTGAVRDFDGVKTVLMAQMKLPPGLKLADKGTETFYIPAEIHRHSKYLYEKGKEVYLLHDPEGHTWVLQSYSTSRNKDLQQSRLVNLGNELTLPAGWKFEAKELDKDLTIIPAGDMAHIVQDNFEDTYEGCGFDNACSYMP